MSKAESQYQRQLLAKMNYQGSNGVQKHGVSNEFFCWNWTVDQGTDGCHPLGSFGGSSKRMIRSSGSGGGSFMY